MKLTIALLSIILVLPGTVRADGPTAAGDGTETVAAFDQSHGKLTQLLRKYVHNGRVDYAGLKKARGDLDAYLADLASVTKATFAGFSRNQKLAFYLNAYNGFTLRLIVDNYPVKSIRNIGGGGDAAWKERHVNLPGLFGKKTSLGHLENGILRPRFKEPRIHFALVCAAKGCPPLPSAAFKAQTLDRTLDTLARGFLKDTGKNRYDPSTHTLYLSKIFDWYKEDFGGTGALPDFFVKFGPKSAAEAMQTALKNGKNPTIAYLDYDWSLNN